jgi:hypothetical protein
VPTGQPTAGPPVINPVDPTPTALNNPNQPLKGVFPQLTASAAGTARLPQDLTKFIGVYRRRALVRATTNPGTAAQTITQDILDNPNKILTDAIVGQTITNTTTFTVSTDPLGKNQKLPDGGISSITFLNGDNPNGANPDGPNANAAKMTATFWIETVQYQVTVPPFPPGKNVMQLQPHAPNPKAPLPTFEIHAGQTHITSPTTITVTATQIQYSQTVILNFAGLSWPHVSVATLVPDAPIPVVLAT